MSTEFINDQWRLPNNENKDKQSNYSMDFDGSQYIDLDNLDFLNKRAIFVYLREISGLNPKQLSVSISNIRKYYREVVGSDDFYQLFKS